MFSFRHKSDDELVQMGIAPIKRSHWIQGNSTDTPTVISENAKVQEKPSKRQWKKVRYPSRKEQQGFCSSCIASGPPLAKLQLVMLGGRQCSAQDKCPSVLSRRRQLVTQTQEMHLLSDQKPLKPRGQDLGSCDFMQAKQEKKAKAFCFNFARDGCAKGAECKFSHDLAVLVASRRPDLTGRCPFSSYASCPFGTTSFP